MLSVRLTFKSTYLIIYLGLQEAICSSLEEYNQHIEELKQEMEEATESAKRIREDIQEMRNKYGVVDSQEKCAACDFPLLNRPFYLFLCGHMFHYDCLFQVTASIQLFHWFTNSKW